MVIREFLVWYTENHGQDRIRELVEGAREDLRRYLGGPDPIANLLAASWYPARLAYLILDKVTEGFPETAIATQAKGAARALVKRQMGNGVYRFFLKRVVTPQLYAASVPRMWRQLHSTGDRRMRITGQGTAESSVSNWTGHHPVLCTITLETMCAVFDLMGCKDVRYKRVTCVSRGATECTTQVTWK